MKKIIFGIFAHPDDEAFGPAGTLLSEVHNGAELHLITLTAGENGSNPDNLPNLGETRLEEWRAAGRLFKAVSMHHLGYTDGQLDNQALLGAADKIEQIVKDTIKNSESDNVVEFISMDTNGITGHIDHIVAGRAASLVFYRLKNSQTPVNRLKLVCIPRDQTGDQPNIKFVFMEPGRLPEEIDEIIDNSDLYDDIIEIMNCHNTQRYDRDYHINRLGAKVAIDHFIVNSQQQT